MTQNGPMRGNPGVLVGVPKKETLCVEVAKLVGCEPGIAGDAFITPREIWLPCPKMEATEKQSWEGERNLFLVAWLE